MKIVNLCSMITGMEFGLNKINKFINDTLIELGVSIQEINLALYDIPYFNGVRIKSVENIFDIIKNADGVIFSSTANLLSCNAVMHTFLQHFDSDVYGDVIKNKKCFIITSSNDDSEREAGNYLSDVINILGAYEITKMCIPKNYIYEIDFNNDIKEMIEKYAEDFYRLLRQNRTFFSSFSVGKKAETKPTGQIPLASYQQPEQPFVQPSYQQPEQPFVQPSYQQPEQPFVQPSYQQPEQPFVQPSYQQPEQPFVKQNKKITHDEFLRKEFTDNFNERQESDIDEITKLMSQQYNQSYNTTYNKQSSVSNLYKENSSFKPKVKPRIQTCKQRTGALAHHFQPQLAQGITANIQINIVDGDNFAGYLVIQNGECTYFDGICDYPDVTIFSTEDVWSDVLNAKCTTQKAFMVGKIKVKGNFILLSKFDQLFKMGL